MKKFIINHIIIILGILLLHLSVLFLINGYSDPYYYKFTTKKQKSLILGLSRACSGINPDILNEKLSKKGLDLPIFNFAFSFNDSPYGPLYYNAIINKLDEKTKNGLFIISVTPYSISIDKNNGKFRELKSNILGVKSMSDPNIEYFLKTYKYGWGKLIFDTFYKNTILYNHKESGWLEAQSNSTKKLSEADVDYFLKNTIQNYSFSELRLSYLNKTIMKLKKHGKVILIRIPVSDVLFNVEKLHMPKFDNLMNDLSKQYDIPYLDFSRKQYKYTDGHHLFSKSAKEFSLDLASELNRFL